MAVSPDGKIIYLPSLENDHWHVIDAASGDVLAKITPKSGAHNTICGLSGRYAYLAGLSRELPQAVDELTPDGRLPTEGEASRWV